MFGVHAQVSFCKQMAGDFVVWAPEDKFKSVYHKPTGPMQHQPNLLRGRGLPCPKVSLYDKQGRRLTVEKNAAASASDFVLSVEIPNAFGCYFSRIFIMPKFSGNDFDELLMKQFARLMFSASADDAQQHFPQKDGQNDLDALRSLMAKYTIVGVKGEGVDRIVIDAHSDFMKKGMSEHSKYIEQYLGPNFGPLGGERATRAVVPANNSPKTRARRRARTLLGIQLVAAQDAPEHATPTSFTSFASSTISASSITSTSSASSGVLGIQRANS